MCVIKGTIKSLVAASACKKERTSFAEYSLSFALKSNDCNFSSPNMSFNSTVLPKNVILYVCGLLFFKSTPSSLILPSLKGKLFNSIVADFFLRASNPPVISKL